MTNVAEKAFCIYSSNSVLRRASLGFSGYCRYPGLSRTSGGVEQTPENYNTKEVESKPLLEEVHPPVCGEAFGEPIRAVQVCGWQRWNGRGGLVGKVYGPSVTANRRPQLDEVIVSADGGDGVEAGLLRRAPGAGRARQPSIGTARMGQDASMGAMGGLVNLCRALRFKASTRSRTLSGASPVRM